ncbi:hypothetical protein HNR60_002807 [Rhodopseudomonas rhenobacensis]|uniref:Trypsin-like peptidase domain-containing protein n=1 Tax=Rhodopseudomonas rhenobacensis TaxID=87461 RepID=A0A7W7Z4U7_9BRAD|nr:serine protease [Rhodopseudomonas rhenobacensis]MBB5048046.1 hypothetical protein [Rhodopseudomonas rhenobacensis]
MFLQDRLAKMGAGIMMSLLLKLMYSVLLLGIAGMAARELWTVWLDTRVYIGAFDVVTDTGRDDPASEAFPKRIVAAQAILAQQMNGYLARRSVQAPTDVTYAIAGLAPLQLPPEALAGVDITVQSINLKQVLTAVRRGFLAPNEVQGHVTERDGAVLAAVDWPRAPAPADGNPAQTQFLVPGRSSVQESAAYIACAIAWARAASTDRTLAAVPRTQLCDFAAALADLYALEDKAKSDTGLEAAQIAVVRRRAASLHAHFGDRSVLPDLYRLRADLLELLPETGRTPNELIDVQEDRLRYAMQSAQLRDLPEETKRLAAQALARPAIILDNGVPKDAPENWAGLLNRHTGEIVVAAAATGIVVGADGQPIGTASIVAPGMIMTASHVMNAARREPNAESPPGAARPRLCLGPSRADCGSSFAIGEMIYDGAKDGFKIVLMQIDAHDPVLDPPLAVTDPSPESNAIVGKYAYVIGYPFNDARLPTEFVDRLLQDLSGRQRMMPGRILALSKAGVAGVPSAHALYTTDISTTGGVGGGPLLDLATGKVIGVSYSGIWQGARGKFAYAETIPPAALALIGRRNRGEPDEAPTAPATGTPPTAPAATDPPPTAPATPDATPADPSAPAAPASR